MSTRHTLASPPCFQLCSALHFAAGLGKVDCIKLLLEAGVDVNLQDKEGEIGTGGRASEWQE